MKKLLLTLLFSLFCISAFAVEGMFTVENATDLNPTNPVGTMTYVNSTDTVYINKVIGFEVLGNKSMATHLGQYDHTQVGTPGVNGTDGINGTNCNLTNIQSALSNDFHNIGGVDAGGYVLVATLASPQATGANTNPVTLTGLVWTYAASSTYFFRWSGGVLPGVVGTGCGFQLDTSGAVTEIEMNFYHQLANTGTLTGGSSGADATSIGVTSAMASNTTITPIQGQGMLRTTVGQTGTAQLQFRSETTAVTTAQAGMTLVVEKVQ